MRRAILGVLTIVLLGVGLCLLIADRPDDYIGPAALRMSILTGIFWLAWPQVIALPRALVAAVLSGGLVLAIRPKLVLAVLRPKVLAVAIPVTLALWFLRPRKRG